MFKFNNSIVPNKVRIGWHFSSNKYAYRDAYSALKSINILRKLKTHLFKLAYPPIASKSTNPTGYNWNCLSIMNLVHCQAWVSQGFERICYCC